MFFTVATLFTQVTMLNMLIAFMGETFSYSVEQHEKFAIMTTLGIFASQAPTLQCRENHDVKEVFMMIVKPIDMEEEEGDWHGSINKIVNKTLKSIDNLKSELKKSMGK